MMMRRISSDARVRTSVILGIVLVLIAAAPALAKEKKQVIEHFQANAMNLDRGQAGIVNVEVFEWSTDETRKALIDAFLQGGNKGAYEYLSQQEDKGFVRFPRTLAYDMRYAFQFEHDGKRQVVLATDRPIGGLELMRNTRSIDNSISFVVLSLDLESGKGEGQMVFGAEFKINEKTQHLEIETVAVQPTKLLDVRIKKVKHKD